MALKAAAHPGRGEMCRDMMAFRARSWEEVLGGRERQAGKGPVGTLPRGFTVGMG